MWFMRNENKAAGRQSISGRIPLLKKRNNLFYYLLLWTPYIAIYQITNRFHIIEPKYLSFSMLDRAIPFVPWMVPVYVSYLVYVFFFIYHCEDDRDLTRIFMLSYFQVLFCALFFVFFPVAFPVDQFYSQMKATDVFSRFWLWFDEPANCFPSLHAANSFLVIYLSQKKTPLMRVGMTAWGGLVVLSTLFSKQHYVIDISAGFGVFVFTLLIAPYVERVLPAVEDTAKFRAN